jgi:hypothetical protein
MSDQRGIPVTRASRGKLIPNLSPDSFFESLYGSLHDFAVQVADSDMQLGPNLDENRLKVVEFLDGLVAAGADVSEVNVDLQARYNTVLEDCLRQASLLIQGNVYSRYKGLDENKPIIIRPF